MTVVILYGPPAVGKLTTARALAELTGFSVLHNHLLIDLSHSMFGSSEARREATRSVRDLMISLAAKYKLEGLILTFVYACNREAYINDLFQHCKVKGFHVALVHLSCSQSTLEKRVSDASRLTYNKLSTVQGLKEKLESLDNPFGKTSLQPQLSVSTDDYSAEQVAKLISSWLAQTGQ